MSSFTASPCLKIISPVIKAADQIDYMLSINEHKRRDSGNLVPAVEQNGREIAPSLGIENDYLEDHIVILGPDGEVRKRIPLLKAIADSAYPATLRRVSNSASDLTHTNSIDYVEKTSNLPVLHRRATC